MTAKENFYKGYNCAQSVAVAFSDEVNIDESTLAKMVSGYGGGIGRLRETCGAVNGMIFIANLLYGYSDPNDAQAKADYYRVVRELVLEFKERVGAIRCADILKNPQIGGDPEQRTQEYYEKRPCPDICQTAEDVLRNYIANHKSY